MLVKGGRYYFLIKFINCMGGKILVDELEIYIDCDIVWCDCNE